MSGAVGEVAEEIKPRTRRKRVSAIAPHESKVELRRMGLIEQYSNSMTIVMMTAMC